MGKTDEPQNKGILAIQILYGAFFAVMGLNHFFGWMDRPESEGDALVFWTGIGAAGYLFTLIFSTQAVSGLLIASGRFTAFGLILLTPVLVNIVGYHLYVERTGLEMALGLSAVHLFLAWVQRNRYKAMFC